MSGWGSKRAGETRGSRLLDKTFVASHLFRYSYLITQVTPEARDAAGILVLGSFTIVVVFALSVLQGLSPSLISLAAHIVRPWKVPEWVQ